MSISIDTHLTLRRSLLLRPSFQKLSQTLKGRSLLRTLGTSLLGVQEVLTRRHTFAYRRLSFTGVFARTQRVGEGSCRIFVDVFVLS